MVRERKSKKYDIEKIHELIDSASLPKKRKNSSFDEKTLETLRKRLSDEPVKTKKKMIPPDFSESKSESLTPRVIVHKRVDVKKKEEKVIQIELGPKTEEKQKGPSNENIIPLTEDLFANEALYEVEKIAEDDSQQEQPIKASEKFVIQKEFTPDVSVQEQPGNHLPEWEPVAPDTAEKETADQKDEKRAEMLLPEFERIEEKQTPVPPRVSEDEHKIPSFEPVEIEVAREEKPKVDRSEERKKKKEEKRQKKGEAKQARQEAKEQERAAVRLAKEHDEKIQAEYGELQKKQEEEQRLKDEEKKKAAADAREKDQEEQRLLKEQKEKQRLERVALKKKEIEEKRQKKGEAKQARQEAKEQERAAVRLAKEHDEKIQAEYGELQKKQEEEQRLKDEEKKKAAADAREKDQEEQRLLKEREQKLRIERLNLKKKEKEEQKQRKLEKKKVAVAASVVQKKSVPQKTSNGEGIRMELGEIQDMPLPPQKEERPLGSEGESPEEIIHTKVSVISEKPKEQEREKQRLLKEQKEKQRLERVALKKKEKEEKRHKKGEEKQARKQAKEQEREEQRLLIEQKEKVQLERVELKKKEKEDHKRKQLEEKQHGEQFEPEEKNTEELKPRKLQKKQEQLEAKEKQRQEKKEAKAKEQNKQFMIAFKEHELRMKSKEEQKQKRLEMKMEKERLSELVVGKATVPKVDNGQKKAEEQQLKKEAEKFTAKDAKEQRKLKAVEHKMQKEQKKKEKEIQKLKATEGKKAQKKRDLHFEEEIIKEKLAGTEERIDVYDGFDSIDKETESLLYKNGYTSLEKLREATVKDLIKIGIKKKTAQNIIAESGEFVEWEVHDADEHPNVKI
jgi:hypothetical protein